MTVTACRIDPRDRQPRATVRVTNPTDRAWDYTISVAFRAADGSARYGTGYTYATRLRPGRTRDAEVIGAGPAHGRLTCRLAGVQRAAPS